jgi:hypothetical protein
MAALTETTATTSFPARGKVIERRGSDRVVFAPSA